MRLSKVIAPLGFAAAALVLCAPALFSQGRLILSSIDCDIAMQFLSWREFGFRELARGNLALWNPHVYSGLPFFGAFESALLYPPNWIHLFLSAPTAINLTIALHLFLAGFFTFLWSRGAGISRAGSFLSGLMFMLSGPYFLKIYAGHLPPLCAMVWAPALFAAIDAMERSAWLNSKVGMLRWTLVAILAASMQIMAGNPQYVYYTWFAAAVYAALRTEAPELKMLTLAYAAVALGALALCAVQVFAAWDAVSESARRIFSPGQAGTFSLPPENIATLLLPRLFGGVGAGSQYSGRWYYWDTCLFASVAGLVLAGCASFKASKPARSAAIMILVLVVLALGAYLPSYKVLYYVLPGYRLLRGSSKFCFLIVLFLAQLAGLGFDDLRAGAWPRRWIIFLFAAGTLLLCWGFYPGRFVAAEIFRCGAILLVCAGLLFYSHTSPGLAYGLWMLAAAELFFFAAGARATMDARIEYPSALKMALKKNPGDYRILSSGMRDPNAAMSLGYYDLMGYSQLSLRRYLEFIALSQGGDPENVRQYPMSLKISRLFGLLRCRFVFLDDPRRPVLELPGALPRLSLVSDWRIAPSQRERFKELQELKFNPTRMVLLESAPSPAPEPGPAGAARVIRETSDEIEIEAELPRAQILLVSDNFSPGWRVEPLGDPVQRHYDVMPADHVLRAVPLSAGRHHFLMEYSPAGFRIGRWVSLAALGLYALCWGWLGMARKKLQ